MGKKLCILLVCLVWGVVGRAYADSVTATFSHALSSSGMDAVTDFGSLDVGCLNQVTINSDAVLTSQETFKIFLESRAGSNVYNSLLVTYDVSSGTQNVSVLFGNSVTLNKNDQIRITTTNNNTARTLYATVTVDLSSFCTGNGYTIYRNGMKVSEILTLTTQGYTTIQDETTNLTARQTLAFVGGTVTCTDDVANSKTVCTFIESSAYRTVQDEGSALTQRAILNFTGAGITCTDDSTNTRTNCTVTGGGGGGGYNTIQDEGTNLPPQSTLNFIGVPITCVDDSGTSRTNCTITESSAYRTVQEEGTNLTQRTTINFTGAEITCSDNSVSGRTDCSVASFYRTIQDEGTALTQQPTLNFTGAGVTCTNDGANSRTTCDIPGGSGGGGGMTIVRKTVDEIVNNSATLQDDDHLFFSGSANTQYYFEMDLITSSGTTPDIKFAITTPTGATLSWSFLNPTTTGLAFSAPHEVATSGTAVAVGTDTTNRRYYIRGFVAVGSTAGNIQLQWAQNTATASDTIVRANSLLRYQSF